MTTSTHVTYPHIIKEEGKPARFARWPRFPIRQVVGDYLQYGWSVAEICWQYPHLNPAEVHSAMAYYYDHQSEIDDEIEAAITEFEESRRRTKPPPWLLRLRAEGKLPPEQG
jgi:hypothetical protein